MLLDYLHYNGDCWDKILQQKVILHITSRKCKNIYKKYDFTFLQNNILFGKSKSIGSERNILKMFLFIILTRVFIKMSKNMETKMKHSQCQFFYKLLCFLFYITQCVIN